MLPGNAGVDYVEPRVYVKRGLQVLFCLGRLPQLTRDHAGVEEQKSIARAGAQRVLARIARLLVFSVLVQSPCERVPGVDVVPYLEFLVGQR